MATVSSHEATSSHRGGEGWLADFAIQRGVAPLHRQIHDLVHQEIVAGRLPHGTQLPPEGDLAERWGVSLAPVRHALLDLTAEGYLERGQGRGTFVCQPKIEEKLSILSSFSSSHAQQGDQSHLVMLHSGLVSPPTEVAAALGSGRRKLALIQRVAYLESSPVALLAAYLDPARFPGIEKKRLEGGSLYRTLASVYGVDLVRATTVMEAIHVTEEEAVHLGTRTGVMVLGVDSVTYDNENAPVEFSRVLYRMERFKFSLESHRFENRIIHFPGHGDEGMNSR